MMDFEITGFDDLHRQFQELIEALRALNGPLCQVNFDPANPALVENALIEMERAVDGKLASLTGSPWVEQLAAALKEKLRDEIIQRASQARSKPAVSGAVPCSTGTPVARIDGTPVSPLGTPVSPFASPTPKGGSKW